VTSYDVASNTCHCEPTFFGFNESYDVTSNVWQALPAGAGGGGAVRGRHVVERLAQLGHLV
jgi:hypothetical protein